MPVTPETSNMYISYVGQEDVFMPTLSAWESLSFITQLCMGPLPRKEREDRMEMVLKTMGLTRVKNSKVISSAVLETYEMRSFGCQYSTKW